MAPAATHRPKTGRPPHAKRNGSHHHVYCRYCSDAQAQALAAPANPAAGPLSIEAIRGVPTKMLRHLSICIYCPASTRMHIRSMADEHAAGPSRKRRRTPEPEAMVPPQPLLDLLLSDGPVRPSAPPVASEKRSAAIALPPDDALAQVALGGHVSWAWAWNPDVSKLLTVNVPSPDVFYERCLRHRAGDPPSMPFASLSVASWTSLCSREFTIACTLQYLHSCTTISIASIAPTLEACLAHLTSVVASSPPLVAILVDSALLLEAAMAALPQCTVDLFEHWLHVGAAVRHYALQWHLDANAVVAHVLELRRGQFPFDSATKALYAEDVCSYYAFLSESHPELHAFCIRLFSIAPACVRYETVLPGLFDAGISPFLARIDIPAQAQCAIVKYSEHSTKRPSAHVPQVLSVDDWLQLRPEIQAFVQSEVDAFATLPITSTSVDLTVFSSCDEA
ncbi:hypothetical protein SPRG_15477 [Saprolegnia parasitica CBS 223.65]|uniref:Uncharacterized protein n=1 Tax=Saprolegnia parasitica (strain CBS 223.65) TaxID=695850 RepID=A0A067BIQ4_SAPPC|nr:hypothetical protein SPRG_15477 [Saprolegnia parasitica CBS 223.65]KDO18269.1 hypothetical protein SPRG_15477 [Saprolegnia parasitica CBS 223.65]|eukprot:XP_012211021.1 hypothetical protein SPRG_15477 [Saprolegnia parasitica CBS 223.65]